MSKFILLAILPIFLYNSCNSIEFSNIEPVIRLKDTGAYVNSDTSLSPGKQYMIGIIASSVDGENLTNLIVESNGQRIFDKGYNHPEISEDIVLVKNLDEIEIINIIIRNKARKSDTVSFVVSKLENYYLPITQHNQVILGAQNNTQTGNYFSFSNGLVYTQIEAYNNQQLIDILYYYDEAGDANTLASPGANLSGIISGTYAPENWSLKRISYYSREPVIINNDDFNNAESDSLIISNLFTGGGRKAKQLQNNQFYAFQTFENKFGIVKIESVSGQADGVIQLSFIIQQ